MWTQQFIQYFFPIVLFHYQPHFTESTCVTRGTLIACTYTLPSPSDWYGDSAAPDVIIDGYNGILQITKGGNANVFSVRSLQILRSSIDSIEPRFFARFSAGKLKDLKMTMNKGTFVANSDTLGGLETTMETLRISDYYTENVDYLSKMTALTSLSLVRTNLTTVPAEFGELIKRLTYLDLSGNQLISLPWDAVAKAMRSMKLSTVRLGLNNWRCDCSMRPLVDLEIELKRKVFGLQCVEPTHLSGRSLTDLNINDICTAQELPVIEDSKPLSTIEKEMNKPKEDISKTQENNAIETSSANGPSESIARDIQVNTAGSVSTEIVAIIIAVVLLFVVILVVIIVFTMRIRTQRINERRSPKHSNMRNTPYCHVIDQPTHKQGGNSESTVAAALRSQANNQYARDIDDSERQPLAPPYHARKDNRL